MQVSAPQTPVAASDMLVIVPPPPLTVQRELSAGIVIDTHAATDEHKLLSPPASVSSVASPLRPTSLAAPSAGSAALLTRPQSAGPSTAESWRSPAPSVRSGLSLDPPPVSGLLAPSPSPAARLLPSMLSARSAAGLSASASAAGAAISAGGSILAQAAQASLRHNCYRVGVFSSIRIGVHNRTTQPLRRLHLCITPFQHTVGGGVDTNLHHKLLWMGSLDNILPTVCVHLFTPLSLSVSRGSRS
jgi:hypothetical protein